MAPFNPNEVRILLSSQSAGYYFHNNPLNERQRLIEFARVIDRYVVNPSECPHLDGQSPDDSRQVKRAKVGLSPPRVNNENAAPNPRMTTPDRYMSPIAENSDKPDTSQHSREAPELNPASASKIERTVGAMVVQKLRKELKKRGLETTGLKRDLQIRLTQSIRKQRKEEKAMQQVIDMNQSEVKSAVLLTNDAHHNLASSNGSKAMDVQDIEPDTIKASFSELHPHSKDNESHEKHSNAIVSFENRGASGGVCDENEPIVIVEVDVPMRRSQSNDDSERFEDAMDCQSDKSSVDVAHNKSLDPTTVSQVGSSSKVLDLVETNVKASHSLLESAVSPKNDNYVDHLATSPRASARTGEDERSKQVLLSLKKSREVSSLRTVDQESKQSTITSVCKVSSLASLRSEQKACLKVNNPGEGFSTNVIKPLPLVGPPTSSKIAVDEARKARLAEMRGKSKPAPLVKPIETPSHLAKAIALFKSKAVSTDDHSDQKRKLLAAQMREKTAAAAMQKKGQDEPKPHASLEREVDDATRNEKKSPLDTMISPKGQPLAAVVQSMLVKQEATPTGPKSQQLQNAEACAQKHHPENLFSPMSTYEISDREYSDSEDEESDDESQENDKNIPKWSRKENLEPALMKQYQDKNRLNPDDIFYTNISTCDLEAIFEKKKSKFRKRTSSGNWAQDRVTKAEQAAYQRVMGYKQAK